MKVIYTYFIFGLNFELNYFKLNMNF